MRHSLSFILLNQNTSHILTYLINNIISSTGWVLKIIFCIMWAYEVDIIIEVHFNHMVVIAGFEPENTKKTCVRTFQQESWYSLMLSQWQGWVSTKEYLISCSNWKFHWKFKLLCITMKFFATETKQHRNPSGAEGGTFLENSIPWLLKPWLHASLGLQRPWYRFCRLNWLLWFQLPVHFQCWKMIANVNILSNL